MKPSKYNLLGVGLSPTSYAQSLELCRQWIDERVITHAPNGTGNLAAKPARYIVHLTVHSVMTAFFDPKVRAALNGATLGAPDGMPLVWALRSFGVKGQPRVYGPDLMLSLCEQSARLGHRIYLYGGRDETLQLLCSKLRERFPDLVIAGAFSPPFRPLTGEEDQECIERILISGADLVFVGIGAPKQERWMFDHATRLPGLVLSGVGAAFDFHVGRVKQAPPWLQNAGLEWFFRLLMEPRRLWKRYLLNPLFLVLWGLEKLGVYLVTPAETEAR
jgi:N-acetylglucosaminyldiphosphoundecaprenol N-acetyl-beta-D-mannosaminyltransferase